MAKAKRVPLKSSVSRNVRRVVAPQPGRPPEPLTRTTFPVIPKPVFAKAKIRMLQKVDPAKGITQPEAANMTDAPGVVTGSPGGYRGARVMHQQPITPPKTGRNQRVLAAPRAGGGKIKKFNKVVGIKQSNKRYGK